MRTRKTLNKPLLRKLALKLRRLRHEEHYDQGGWFTQTACGTAACIGGYAALLAGRTFVLPVAGTMATHCRKTRGEKRNPHVMDVARHALGLRMGPARRLFTPAGMSWPEEFRNRWFAMRHSMSGERPSRIAADLLDAIADGKVSL